MAQTPAAMPAARSISPSSSTNTSPIAMKMVGEDCLSRSEKLASEPKVGCRIQNTMTSTIRPATAGSEPMSPLRTRWT